jgi:uncharacterized membrane protein YeaQ/YmgE (transglycosylase-associated protein family)
VLAKSSIGVVDVLIYILAGLVIGALARLIVPGRQAMGVLATIIVGVVAAVGGGLLWNAIFPDNDGIAWIGALILAVILVYIYAAIAPRMGRTRAP